MTAKVKLCSHMSTAPHTAVFVYSTIVPWHAILHRFSLPRLNRSVRISTCVIAPVHCQCSAIRYRYCGSEGGDACCPTGMHATPGPLVELPPDCQSLAVDPVVVLAISLRDYAPDSRSDGSHAGRQVRASSIQSLPTPAQLPCMYPNFSHTKLLLREAHPRPAVCAFHENASRLGHAGQARGTPLTLPRWRCALLKSWLRDVSKASGWPCICVLLKSSCLHLFSTWICSQYPTSTRHHGVENIFQP